MVVSAAGLCSAAALFSDHLFFIAAANLARPFGLNRPFFFPADAAVFADLAGPPTLTFVLDLAACSLVVAANFRRSWVSFFVSFAILAVRRRIFLSSFFSFIDGLVNFLTLQIDVLSTSLEEYHVNQSVLSGPTSDRLVEPLDGALG
jgi:hypothetical protein